MHGRASDWLLQPCEPHALAQALDEAEREELGGRVRRLGAPPDARDANGARQRLARAVAIAAIQEDELEPLAAEPVDQKLLVQKAAQLLLKDAQSVDALVKSLGEEGIEIRCSRVNEVRILIWVEL